MTYMIIIPSSLHKSKQVCRYRYTHRLYITLYVKYIFKNHTSSERIKQERKTRYLITSRWLYFTVVPEFKRKVLDISLMEALAANQDTEIPSRYKEEGAE